mgnify:CR=1 FL=1
MTALPDSASGKRPLTSEDDHLELSKRLASLERLVRLSRTAVVVLASTQALWFLMGAYQQPASETRQFSLVDKDGKPRIKMLTDAEGNPSLTFLDTDGTQCIYLGIGDSGTQVELTGKSKSVAGMQVQRDGIVTFVLEDAKDQHIDMFVSSAEADPKCEIRVANSINRFDARLAAHSKEAFLDFSKAARVPLSLGVDADGGAVVSLGGDKESAVLKTDAAGASSLILKDKAGDILLKKP